MLGLFLFLETVFLFVFLVKKCIGEAKFGFW